MLREIPAKLPRGLEVFDFHWKCQWLQGFNLRARTWGGFGNTTAFPHDFNQRSFLLYPRTSKPFKMVLNGFKTQNLDSKTVEEKWLLLPLRGNPTRPHQILLEALKSQRLPLIPTPAL